MSIEILSTATQLSTVQKNPILKRLKIGQSEMLLICNRPNNLIALHSFQYITTVSVYDLSDLEKSFSFETTVEITGCVRFVMAAVCYRAGHYIFALWFLSIFLSCYIFFPRLISAAAYFGTWCGLSANLECRSEMCCARLAANTGRKKSPSGHHPTTLSGCIFATKACIDNREKTC